MSRENDGRWKFVDGRIEDKERKKLNEMQKGWEDGKKKNERNQKCGIKGNAREKNEKKKRKKKTKIIKKKRRERSTKERKK